MDSSSTVTITPSNVNRIGLPDLTDTLLRGQKRLTGTGSFGTVYRCVCALNGEVAVKAISFPRSFRQLDRDELLRKMKREFGIWRRLDHPNIVPLVGTARGEDFGSDYTCMVSMWMPHGTLTEYVWEHENMLPLPSRIQLITGSAAGLKYLHSKSIVHGDFHPGNILIDSDHNPRLTDFGFSHHLIQQNDKSYYSSGNSGYLTNASIWVAPELLYPDLYPDYDDDSMVEPMLNSDIYSLGSIILFILSGKPPWNKVEFESKSDDLQNPPRPLWPVLPDAVWNFIERCWSPQVPRDRPSAQEVVSFSRDRLEQVLQPSAVSDINVVLFGALGCGKSSIINLLAGEPVAPVSTNTEPCTKHPRCYPISVGERQFRLWDTAGFRLPRGEDISPLSAYEQAHAVLRDLPNGVHILLLCARKDEIYSSLGRLYWLINDFFFSGRAPIVLVVTHFDTPDQRWLDRNQRPIVRRTGIPIQSIPCLCSTTVQTGRDQSRETLRTFLETVLIPIPLCLNLSSHEAASLATRCGLSDHDARVLVEQWRPRHEGQEEAGKPSLHRPGTRSKAGDRHTLALRRLARDLLEKSHQLTDGPSCSPSPTGVIATNERPSTMSGTPVRRGVPKSTVKPEPKSPPKPAVSGDTSRGTQGQIQRKRNK